MQKVVRALKTYASGRVVFRLFVATTAVYLAMLFYFIPSVLTEAPDMKLFDMSPTGYSYEYAMELIGAIGENGRDTYLKQQLPADFIYPGLFAITYTLMLTWILSKVVDGDSKYYLLVFVPAVAGIFDYVENIGIITMLVSYPDLGSGVVAFSSVFSILKSGMTVLFYLILIGTLLKSSIKTKAQQVDGD